MKRTIVLIAIALTSCVVQKNKNTIDFAKNSVVAHRGAWKSKDLPENSIASLKHAIAIGCTGTEFDVRMTADDSLIINHDPHYNKLEIEKVSYSELSQSKLANGEILPTLRQYLLTGIHGNKKTRLVCEIKPSGISKERGKLMAEKTLSLVKELRLEKMMVYISFDYDIMKKIVEINPKAITQYLNGDKSPEQLRADGIQGADYHFSVFKSHPEWIDSAKKNNIALNVWTVNNADDMKWFHEKGFDFITTNEPELLLTILKK
ncbi:MAG: glycerophosphodiester phosphodiesterase family protein [Spirosomataceae bacterium]